MSQVESQPKSSPRQIQSQSVPESELQGLTNPHLTLVIIHELVLLQSSSSSSPPTHTHLAPPLTGVSWGWSKSTSSGQALYLLCPTVILNLPAHLALTHPWTAWAWEMKLNGGGDRVEVLHPLFIYLFIFSLIHSLSLTCILTSVSLCHHSAAAYPVPLRSSSYEYMTVINNCLTLLC